MPFEFSLFHIRCWKYNVLTLIILIKKGNKQWQNQSLCFNTLNVDRLFEKKKMKMKKSSLLEYHGTDHKQEKKLQIIN